MIGIGLGLGGGRRPALRPKAAFHLVGIAPGTQVIPGAYGTPYSLTLGSGAGVDSRDPTITETGLTFGGDRYAKFGPLPIGTKDFTIIVVFTPTAAGGTIYSNRENGVGGVQVSCDSTNNNRLSLFIADASGSSSSGAELPIQLNAQSTLILSFDRGASATPWLNSLPGPALTISTRQGSVTTSMDYLAAWGQLSLQFMTGEISHFRYYEKALNTPETLRVLRQLSTLFPSAIPSVRIVCEGDSITDAGHSSTSYPAQLYAAYAGTVGMANTAVSGSWIDDVITRGSAVVDPLYMPEASKNVIAVMAGINGLGTSEHSGAENAALVQSYCEARRAVGWKVLVCALLPAGAAAEASADWTSHNDYIRTNWAEFADGLCDVNLDTDIGEWGDQNNTTYYSDKVHLTAAGRTVLANMVKTALDASILAA